MSEQAGPRGFAAPKEDSQAKGWDIAKQVNSHQAREDPMCQRPMQVEGSTPRQVIHVQKGLSIACDGQL